MISQELIAKKYASAGISVFPCNKNKKPLTQNGFKDATTDASKIQNWWTKHPDALVGSPNDQFTVIDIDDYDIPEECSWIVKGVVESLKTDKVIHDDVMKIRTVSGGTHLYYMKDESISRMIHVLPQIDILAEGGYVILPDQKSYIAENESSPWDCFQYLPKLDMKTLKDRADSMHDLTKFVTRTVKEYRKGQTGSDGSPTVTMKQDPKEQYQSDLEKYNKVREENPEKSSIGVIDYEKDSIHFDIKDGIYQLTEKQYESINPKESLLTNGTIHIDAGMITSNLLMRLFYNNEVQERLALFLNLPLPKNKPVSTRSILPGHIDSNPSMGVRWNERKTHLLVRDFSNHFNDKYEQTDYNLVRLYATLQYKTNVPRLNSPEFTAWFLRMLVDAGMVNIDTLKTEFIKSTDSLNTNQKKMLESLQLLDAIKRLHEKYDGQFVAADKFISAWSGLSVSTCNRHKKTLVDRGYIVHVGEFNCCPSRKDDFFNTKLYKMAEMVKSDKHLKIKGTTMKLSEAFTQSISTSPKKTQSPHTVQLGQDREEQEVQDRYPTLSTYAGFVISPQHHEKIKNFALDYGIPNVPDIDNMIVPIFADDKYMELDEIEIDQSVTYFIDSFVLEVVDGMDGDSKVLLVHGTSPPLLQLIEDCKARYGYDVEPIVSFVASYDIGDEFDEDRLEYLEMMFNSYLPYVSTNTFNILHMTEDQVMLVMDGKNPIVEDD